MPSDKTAFVRRGGSPIPGLIGIGLSFAVREYQLEEPQTPRRAVFPGRAIVTLREPWHYGGRDYPNGVIVAYALRDGAEELVFAPRDTQFGPA